MKNLINRYGIPTTGWDWWYVDESDYRYEEDEYGYIKEPDPFYYHNRFFDNPVTYLPDHERMRSNDNDRRYYRDCKYCDLAYKILKGSEGRVADEVLNKIRIILRRCAKYSSRINDWMADHISQYERHANGYVFIDRYGGYRSHRYGDTVYSDEEGILRTFRRDKPRKPKRTSRQQYEHMTWRRRSNKESILDKEREALLLLHMINKPEWMYYYRNLLSEYKQLNELEQRAQEPPPDRSKYEKMTGLHSYQYDRRKWAAKREEFTLEKRRRRDYIRWQLDKLRTGDFSSYYQSTVYLYSLYKDCPHFDNP